MNTAEISSLKKLIKGEVFSDNTSKTIYATDASAYKEFPQLVVVPKDKHDVKKVIEFANQHKLSIIPRTAGTSIAGQVVGNGIIVDCSKYMNKILEVNKEEKWVRVEPGVVLDELNMYLKNYGLFFGPETSTSNRCMIGGMVGNNSCGAHSLIYGSTREHTLEIEAFLSDGSEVTFKPIGKYEFEQKCKQTDFEGEIYKSINLKLLDNSIKEEIIKEFPDPRLERRNTGYAVDILLNHEPYNPEGENFNMCRLLCGSEGTLAFSNEIKLNLVDLPPKDKGLLVVHLKSIEESLKANLVALKFNPGAIELMDKYILDCTKTSREHAKNRFFIDGDPGALLCVEFARDSKDEIKKLSEDLITALKDEGYGYHFPLLFGSDISKVWALRKAGLGLLSNVPGDGKPQPVIEDTAVIPEYLPDYIADFNKVLKENGLSCVYYAHIATGELHLRPVFELKSKAGQEMFHTIAFEVAKLVKKYKGSLSGEHGDGRLRGEFIPYMIGEKNYTLLRDIKNFWDPNGVFNQNKITDTPKMNSSLRFVPDQQTPELDTVFDFSDTQGLVRMAEKCNGSADCRKSAIIGGTMCPSYQASRDESTTTRARANMLRETINYSQKENRFDNKELYNILDLCLSCKGCKTECPSGVDMAKLKAEFLHQYYKSHKVPLRTVLVANFTKIQSIASQVAGVYNFVVESKMLSSMVKGVVGFAKERSLPKVHRKTLSKWIKRNLNDLNTNVSADASEVFFFVDEFTNFNDTPIGIKTLKLLNKLGYKITVLQNKESGRTYLSKGRLDQAKKLADFHVTLFAGKVNQESPLIGIEPSAILSFRDEYPDLLRDEMKEKALVLSNSVYTIEEFLAKEIEAKKISRELFSLDEKEVLYHGHCQQKAISGTNAVKTILSFPENYSIKEINSGCCGMAGSFGYEKEHFDLSMKVGELVLFPAVREASEEINISASGTSCRHQIKDGTSKEAEHPVEILFKALK